MHTGFWRGNLKERGRLGRPKLRLVDNIKMNVKEMEWEGMDWSHMARDRGNSQAVVKMVTKLGGFIKWRELIQWFLKELHCMSLRNHWINSLHFIKPPKLRYHLYNSLALASQGLHCMKLASVAGWVCLQHSVVILRFHAVCLIYIHCRLYIIRK